MIRRFANFFLAAMLLAAPFGAAAQKIVPVERAATEKGKEKEKEKAPSPAPEPSPPPYEPQLLRLSEMMGALTYLRGLCGERDAETYRAKMAALLAAEATSDARKDRLAGAYNRGFQGYALTYRTCTPAARVVIARFLDEAARVSKDLANRYGG